MGKIFISYSSRNQKLAEKFLEFLQLGMGIRREDMFCTAFSESLETGESFIKKIREGMEACETVISLITEEYLKSKFCMVEMGAAWGMSKRYFPLLLVPFKELDGTPLVGVQMRNLDNRDDLSTVYDEILDCHAGMRRQTAEFNKRMDCFLDWIHQWKEGKGKLFRDEEGYYHAEILKVRWVGDKYRCYQIKGQIADPPDGGKAGSDWLFFQREMYPELQVGDRVRFQVSRSAVKTYPDLGPARNLYLNLLEKCE